MSYDLIVVNGSIPQKYQESKYSYRIHTHIDTMSKINFTNKLTEMREKVRIELDHINRGGELQNMVRMLYQMQRMHSLGKKAKTESTKEEVLSLVITEMKKRYPGFEPEYDHQFFRANSRSSKSKALDEY